MMSKIATATHIHYAKDGLYYETYEEMRNANVRFNQAHLESMGLAEIKAALRRQTKKRPKKVIRRVVTPRRSNRVRKTPPANTGLQDDSIDRVIARNKKKQKRSNNAMLSEEDRQKLANLPDWMEDMEGYLIEEENLSQQNFRSVMRQVSRLATGVGITYSRWDDNIVFYKRTCIDLSWNFNALYDQAVEFENEHGRDLGNGWLLRHPIKKMQNFQAYCWQKRNKENAKNSTK